MRTLITERLHLPLAVPFRYVALLWRPRTLCSYANLTTPTPSPPDSSAGFSCATQTVVTTSEALQQPPLHPGGDEMLRIGYLLPVGSTPSVATDLSPSAFGPLMMPPETEQLGTVSPPRSTPPPSAAAASLPPPDSAPQAVLSVAAATSSEGPATAAAAEIEAATEEAHMSDVTQVQHQPPPPLETLFPANAVSYLSGRFESPLFRPARMSPAAVREQQQRYAEWRRAIAERDRRRAEQAAAAPPAGTQN